MASGTVSSAYDKNRDTRAPTKHHEHLLELDAATVAEWIASGQGIVPSGLDWLRFTQDRHWHPSWAAAVARRYAANLAKVSAGTVDAASTAAMYGQELASLRRRRDAAWASGDTKAANGLNGPILECMRILAALNGISTEAKGAGLPAGSTVNVLVQAGGRVNLNDLGRLTDEQLRAKLAEAEAAAGEDDGQRPAGTLGGGSPLVPSAAEAPLGSPPTPPSPPSSKKGTQA